MQKKMSIEEEKKIRAKLGDIDGIFKSECVFCGVVLLDMIDNNITVMDDKDSEFGAIAPPNPNKRLGDELTKVSWDII